MAGTDLYVPKRTTYKLTFADGDLEGLVAEFRGTTISGLLKLAELGDELDALDTGDATAGEMRKRLETALGPLGRLLVSWNVGDEDGNPVPATLAGLLDQEIGFLGELITAYVTEMSKAPPPLPASSASGPTSPEQPPGLADASKPLPSS